MVKAKDEMISQFYENNVDDWQTTMRPVMMSASFILAYIAWIYTSVIALFDTSEASSYSSSLLSFLFFVFFKLHIELIPMVASVVIYVLDGW